MRMLRKVVLCLAVVSLASMVFAQGLPIGHVMIKLNDYTSLYDANGDPIDPYAVPKHDVDGIFYEQGSGAGQHPWVGLELRGILHCTSYGIESPQHGGTYTQHWSDGDGGIQITGVIQGFETKAVYVDADPFDPNKFDLRIFYSPTGVPKDWDAPGALPGATPTDVEGREAGGRSFLKASPFGGPGTFSSDPMADGDGADEWIDTSSWPPFTPTPPLYDNDPYKRLEYPTANVWAPDPIGPPPNPTALNRVAAGIEQLMMDGTAMPIGTLGGPDGQPGVAGVDDDVNGVVDDQSELSWPGSDDIDYNMMATLTFEYFPLIDKWGALGDVTLWFNSVRRDQLDEGTDSAASAHTTDTGGTVIPDYWGVGRDAWMFSNLQWGYAASGIPLTVDGWQFRSQDPFRFYTVPEPATMALLGLGLLGVVRRRRKKA